MTEMESQTQQDELLPRVTFVATPPTDEILIAAAKSGDHPAFWNYGRATPVERSKQLIGSQETDTMRKTRSRIRG